MVWRDHDVLGDCDDAYESLRADICCLLMMTSILVLIIVLMCVKHWEMTNRIASCSDEGDDDGNGLCNGDGMCRMTGLMTIV